MHRGLFIPILVTIIILLDIYVYQAVKVFISDFSIVAKRIVIVSYWSLTVLTLSGIGLFVFLEDTFPNRFLRNIILVWILIHFLSKTLAVIFVLADDLLRLVRFAIQKMTQFADKKAAIPGKPITRSEFLAKSAVIAGAIPAITMGMGMLTGAYNFRVRKKTIVLPNLPSEFDGIRIGQLSDIHAGSFYNKSGIESGFDLLLDEKPDVIFFTGDLVNNHANEVEPYTDLFKRVKAPLGVYAVLGNHDYGDYQTWPSAEAKRKNLENLIAFEREMGWDVLMNENRLITVDGQALSVIGVENWGKGRFQKYGDLQKAYVDADAPVKLLLSHDPSHWDAQIRPGFGDIDVTFAGHTHGFQFGVEIGGFQWSPSQYMYEQWAGLYQKGQQYIYVNRGFGFIGYPGRVGIWPEVTVIELIRK